MRRTLQQLLVVVLIQGLLAPIPAAAHPDGESTFAGQRSEVMDAGSGDPAANADGFTGAGTFSFPIQAIQGTGGHTPSVALQYNSHSREDSWVGYGWTLGTSSISRSLKKGTPRYVDSGQAQPGEIEDSFLLDGQDLIVTSGPVTSGGVTTTRYTTKRESFVKVTHLKSSISDIWEVESKNGTKAIYGKVDGSNVDRVSRTVDGNVQIYAWLLSEQEDAYQNIIDYDYDTAADAGAAYLKTITYSRHRSDGGFVGGERTIEFTLDPVGRNDQPTSYRAGFEQRLSQRLSTIDVKAAGVLVRRYKLAYATSEDSFRSLLASVSVYGTDGAAQAPATPQAPFVTRFGYRSNIDAANPANSKIGWEAPQQSWSFPSGLQFVTDPDDSQDNQGSRDRGVRLVDVNGDGRPDLVRAYAKCTNPDAGCNSIDLEEPSGVYLAKTDVIDGVVVATGWESAASGTYPLPRWTSELGGNGFPIDFHFSLQTGDPDNGDGTVWGSGYTALDLTGDGRAEFIGATAKARAPSEGGFPSEQEFRNRWCSSTETGIVCMPAHPTSAAPAGHVRDRIFHTSRLSRYPASSSSNDTKLGGYGGNSQFGDLNGDGLPEIITRGWEKYDSGPFWNWPGYQSEPVDLHRVSLYSYVNYNRSTGAAVTTPAQLEAALDFAEAPVTTLSNGQKFGYDATNTRISADFLPCNPTVGTQDEARDCARKSLFALAALRHPRRPTQFGGDYVADAFWGYGHQDYGAYVVDLNGDGLDDQTVSTLRNSDEPTATTWINNGLERFTPNDSWNLMLPAVKLVSPNPNDNQLGILQTDISREMGLRLADINGDGRVDLLSARESDSTDRKTWLNDGDVGDFDAGKTSEFPIGGPWREQTLSGARSWDLPNGLNFVGPKGRDRGIRLADIDADGMVDVVYGRGSNRQVFLNRGEVPDLLETVTDPSGNKTKLTYQPSSSFVGGHADAGGVPRLPSPVQVVSQIDVTEWSGVGRTLTTKYTYTGGRWDSADREFRGFATVKRTDQLGRTFTTNFHQTAARSGMILSQRTSRISGSSEICYRETFNTYTSESAVPYRTFVKKVRTREYAQFAQCSSASYVERLKTMNYDFDISATDPVGNVVSTTEYGAVTNGTESLLPGEPVRTTFVAYASAPTSPVRYLRTRVIRSALRAGTTEVSPLVRGTWFYYDDSASGYNPKPLRVRAGSSNGPETTFDYDKHGNLETVTEPTDGTGFSGGGTTTTTYDTDTKTFPVSVTNAKNQVTTSIYDGSGVCPTPYPAAAGLVQQVQTPNATNRAISCYDVFGRPTITRAADNLAESTTTYLWDPRAATTPAFHLIRTSHRNGGTTTLVETTSDSRKRVLWTSSRGHNNQLVWVEQAYDEGGRLAFKSAPYFDGDPPLFTVYEYDDLDRIEFITPPGTPTRWKRFFYVPGSPSVVQVRDESNDWVYRKSDGFGNVTTIVEWQNNTSYETKYQYDVAGGLTKVTDQANNQTVIGYDTLGQKLSLADPDKGVTGYEYYPNGNLKKRTTGAGVQETWRYDALNRPTKRLLDGADDASWTYDNTAAGAKGIGLLHTQSDAAGVYAVSKYDALGRARTESRTSGGVTHEFKTTYDDLGNIATREYPGPQTYQWVRDANGLATSITRTAPAAQTIVSEIAYNAAGAVSGWTAGATGGVRTTSTFHLAPTTPSPGNLDRIRVTLGSTELENLQYGFDLEGRLTSLADQRAGSPTAGTRTFGYDDFDRLLTASGRFGDGLADTTFHYSYDPIGNILCKDATNLAGCVGGLAMSYGMGPAGPHAATGVGPQTAIYSPTGNLLSLGGRKYVYDKLDRMTEAWSNGSLVSQYVYDATGSRVRAIDKRWSATRTQHFLAGDFDWDQGRGISRVHLALGGSNAATVVSPYAPAAAGEIGAFGWRPFGADPVPFVTFTIAGLFALGFAVQLELLRRRGAPLRTPALAGVTVVAFWLTHGTLAMALVPNGDVNGDQRLDAADLQRLYALARGSGPAPTASELAWADVHPMSPVPDGQLGLRDALLFARSLAGIDVDGDTILNDAELARNASPFRADSDGDGLRDDQEVFSDASKTDTDLDGVSDWDEMNAQRDPMDPNDQDRDGDGLVGTADSDDTRAIIYRHSDHLGSSVLLTRQDGGVIERVLYRPFGQRVPTVAGGPSNAPSFGFTGQRFEISLGIYDYGARWYDPVMGRFLQADSMVPGPLNPQTLNRYAYVLNSPTSRIDPSGNWSLDFGYLFGTLSYDSVGIFDWGWGDYGLGGSFSNGLFGFEAYAGYGDGAFEGTIGAWGFGAHAIAGFDWTPGQSPTGFVNTPLGKAGMDEWTLVSRPAPDPVPSEYYDQGSQRHMALFSPNGNQYEVGPHQDPPAHDDGGMGQFFQRLSTPERVMFNNPETMSNTDTAMDAGTAFTRSVWLNETRANNAIDSLRGMTENGPIVPYNPFQQGSNSNWYVRQILREGGDDIGTLGGYNPGLGWVPSGLPFAIPRSLETYFDEMR